MKKIVINPAFLNLNKKKKNEKKKKPVTLKSNKIKEAFLNKIKDHQKRKKYNPNEFKQKLQFENDFVKALDYLKKVQYEKPPAGDPNKNVHGVGVTKKKVTDDPPWGILKNGKKPLYRQYKNTLKRREESARMTKLNQIKGKIRNNSAKTFKKYIRRRLGKQKNRKVYVLIDNKTERRKQQIKHRTLKNKRLSSVKNELKKRGFLKTGSMAPQNIIRTIYEASSLAGDIVNIGKGVLLHNYLNKDDLKVNTKIII